MMNTCPNCLLLVGEVQLRHRLAPSLSSGHWVRHCTHLHCTSLSGTVLQYTLLLLTALHYSTQHCPVLHYTTLPSTAPYCTALNYPIQHCPVVHCTALPYPALPLLHCTVLNCTDRMTHIHSNISTSPTKGLCGPLVVGPSLVNSTFCPLRTFSQITKLDEVSPVDNIPSTN